MIVYLKQIAVKTFVGKCLEYRWNMENTIAITKNELKKSCAKHYRVGEKVVCSNNMIVEIIAYRNHKDIDVRYEDGYIIEHTTYQSYFQRSCPRSDKKPVIWCRGFNVVKKMIGKKRRTLHGYRTLLNVRNYFDVDYIDDNGETVYHKSFATFYYNNTMLHHHMRKGKLVAYEQ